MSGEDSEKEEARMNGEKIGNNSVLFFSMEVREGYGFLGVPAKNCVQLPVRGAIATASV